jgi:hypothetical protein
MRDQGEAGVRSAPDEPDEKKRGSWITDHVNLVTAVIGLVAAVLGLFGGREIERRLYVDDDRSSLEERVDELTDENSELAADRDRWKERAQTTTTTTVAAGPITTDPPPGATYLVDVDRVTDAGWDERRDLDLDGTTYAHGLQSDRFGYCGTNGPGVEHETEFSLGRSFQTFHSLAGLSEDSPAGLPVKLDIYLDGTPAKSYVLNVGAPVTIDLDVANVLRMRLVATKQFNDPGGCNYVYAALGDPVLE